MVRAAVTIAIVLLCLLFWWVARKPAVLPPRPANSVATAPVAPALPPGRSPSAATAGAPPAAGRSAQQFDWFRTRPFAVVKSSGQHEWTAEDGRDPDAILDIAHNELEVERLMAENARIKRRQLVYRKETVPMLLQRATGAPPLRSFMLPGLDGQEVEVEVTEIHENASLHGGSVTGRVKGRWNSMVSVGFVNGYESFNVLSPDDGLFLTADAREPGEVIVKEIDPDKYAPPLGDEPDFVLTNQSQPQARNK
jgi:hypothetical protein